MILLLTSWYVYAIYGSCLLIENNTDRNCYVAPGAITPTPASELDSLQQATYQDAAKATRYVGVLGLAVLLIQGVLLILAGCHRMFAWLASFSLVGWLWYLIDLHRVRYSHAGEVCFGDFIMVFGGQASTEEQDSLYLTSEGTFLRYMIIS